MLTETSSTCTLAAADPFDYSHSRKRKLSPGIVGPESTSSNTKLQHASLSTTHHQSVKPLESFEQELSLDEQQQPERSRSGSGASHPTKEVEEGTKREGDLANTDSTDILNDGTITKPLGNEQHRFFLLRPRTTSSRHVLIPLDPSTTLAECLRGRTVLEFPTIYVFTNATAQLPEEFMLEDDYLKQEGEEQEEFDKLMRDLDPQILKRLKEDRSQGDEEKEEEVDSERILDVLKRDLGTEL